MGYLRIAAFAGIGMMVALAVLPQTRWVLQNDIGAMLGKGQLDRFYGCLDAHNWPEDTRDHQLARAVHLENTISNPNAEMVKLGPLETFCRAHPDDVEGWAHLLRMSTMMPLRSPDELKQKGQKIEVRHLAERQRRRALMSLAIANGERLEPDNIYFTVLKAALLEDEGKRPEAEAAVLDASRKSGYNDHASEEATIVYQTALSTCGYRGAAMELTSYAGILLPHLSSMRTITYITRDKVELQRAGLKTVHTIAAKASYGFVPLVMKGNFHRILLNRPGLGEIDPEELKAAAAALDKKLGTHEAEEFLADFNKVDYTRVQRPAGEESMEEFFEQASLPPLFAAVVLLGLVLAVPTAFAAAGLSRFKLWMLRREGITTRPWLWTFWACLLILAVAGAIAAEFVGQVPGPLGLAGKLPEGLNPNVLQAVSVLLLIVGVMAIPRMGSKPLTAIALLFTLLPVLYLGRVVQELRTDQGLKKVMRNAPHEVDVVRGDWSR